MKRISNIETAVKKYFELLRKKKPVSIIQLGSSLRQEDFRKNSDIDFLVICRKPAKKFIVTDCVNDVEVNLIRYGKNQFIKSLEEGNPVSLIALKFGKVLYDSDFFRKLRKRGYKQSEKTIEKWNRTATFNLMDASMNYSFPSCIECYFKALHHAAREFCRVIILKEQGELVEGDRLVLMRLKRSHPDLCSRFRLIIDGRKNYGKFKPRYVKKLKIGSYGLGKYLLAAEDIAIKSLEISLGVKMPKINRFIEEIQKKYRVDSFRNFHIEPERKELFLSLVLEGEKPAFFTYDMKSSRLKRL